MATPTFKRGDVGDNLTAVVNMDLTDCVVRFLARKKFGEEVFELEIDASASDLAEGIVVHVMDGTLDVGRYVTEIEATRGGEVFTFPTSSQLPEFTIIEDLG